MITAATNNGGGGAGSLLFFAIIPIAFYFLLIRPQRNRAKMASRIQQDIQIGTEVVTTAGLYGRVAQIDDDSVLLEVAPGVTNRYVRAAVARVVSPIEPAHPAEPADPADEPPTRPDGPASGPTG